jgi:hypothetical protein
MPVDGTIPPLPPEKPIEECGRGVGPFIPMFIPPIFPVFPMFMFMLRPPIMFIPEPLMFIIPAPMFMFMFRPSLDAERGSPGGPMAPEEVELPPMRGLLGTPIIIPLMFMVLMPMLGIPAIPRPG